MKKLKVNEGPWKEIFNGKFQNYDLRIYYSPSSMLLVSIDEMKKGKLAGSMIEVYRVFYAQGDVEEFVETLPKEIIVLSRHDKEKTNKFLLLGSKPSYVSGDESEFEVEADLLVKKVKASSKMIKDVSKAYNLELDEIENSDSAAKGLFFSQPLIIPTISTAYEPSVSEVKSKSFGEVILGLSKEKNTIKEPLSLFAGTIISGGTSEERAHIIRIMIESCLLSSVATAIIDNDQYFAGLREPTDKLQELQDSKIEIVPIGFPIKEFVVPQQLKVNLKNFNIAGLIEGFGAGDGVSAKKISEIGDGKECDSIDCLIKEVEKIKEEGEWNEFQKNRSNRLLRLVLLHYPNLFSGENDIQAISKSGIRGLGRAGIIRVGGNDERAKLFIINSVIKEMIAFFKTQGKTDTLRSVFVLPDCERFVSAEANSILEKEIISGILELAEYGVGMILASEKEEDISEELVKNSTASITIVGKRDAGVKLRGRKSYRVKIRPSLSKEI